VPPLTSRKPWLASELARRLALATTWRWYSENAGSIASLKQTALAAMMCISGPPCTPGNRARSRSFAYRSRQRMSPARGPRSVLCVVEVTKSACGTGLGCTPPATRPAMCAMSTTIGVPMAAAARAIRSKSMTRG